METAVKKKRIQNKLGICNLIYKDGIPYKKCSCCKRVLKSSSEFFRVQTSERTGFYSRCKKCMGKPTRKVIKHFNINGDLLCFICKEYKHPEFFNNDKNYALRNHKTFECKSCKSVRGKIKYKLKILKESGADPLNFFLRRLLNGIKGRSSNLCKKGKLKYENFDLTIDFLKELYLNQNGNCYISGIKMTYTIGEGFQHYNISLDRLDCNKGYTKDNVKLACSHVNAMRGNLNLNEFISICDKIIRQNGK